MDEATLREGIEQLPGFAVTDQYVADNCELDDVRYAHVPAIAVSPQLMSLRRTNNGTSLTVRHTLSSLGQQLEEEYGISARYNEDGLIYHTDTGPILVTEDVIRGSAAESPPRYHRWPLKS